MLDCPHDPPPEKYSIENLVGADSTCKCNTLKVE